MLKKYTIYGERCSGTTYLENIIDMNFEANLTWEYGWKHFFGFLDDRLKNSDDTLFICIVKNLPDWINSLYRNPHHLPKSLTCDINNFLNNEFYSVPDWRQDRWYKDNHNILGEDRNIYTKERYKNIFELRHTKIKWMIEDLPNKVKNYIFIRYEDLITDFDKTLLKIRDKGLTVKKNINFPLNVSESFLGGRKQKTKFIKKKNNISTEFIMSNSNLIPLYEQKIYNI